MMRYFLLTIMAFTFLGCAGKRVDNLEDRVDQQDQKIAGLEKKEDETRNLAKRTANITIENREDINKMKKTWEDLEGKQYGDVTATYGEIENTTDEIYTVRSWEKYQDCLWNIARREYGNPELWKMLYQANSQNIEDPDLIYPGQTILIPRE